MPDLLQIIAKRKREKAAENGDLKQLVLNAAEDYAKQELEELKQQIIDEAKIFIDRKVNDWKSGVKKGDKGDKGNKGERGDKGEVGEKGDKGEKPIAGIDYPLPKDGERGEKGEKGEPGRDGSPDTALDIAKKLNEKEEIVEQKVIKGLEKTIRDLRSSIREKRDEKVLGGGGMGLPVHQTFTGDGSTTSFSLSTNVAASGRAAWVYYNGQFLVNSTHWSISGKTLTLTFIPEVDTKIDVTYIRA